MKLKKIISAITVLMLILCGCALQTPEVPASLSMPAEEDTPDVQKPLVLRVPYDYSEGASPYTAKSRSNRYVCRLVYSSMVNLLPNYSYELDLLSEIKTDDNITWYLYVAEGSAFPDGTEFTAYDLRYSLQQAMRDDS
jgi:ABC-type transport system substrate-binding protein